MTSDHLKNTGVLTFPPPRTEQECGEHVVAEPVEHCHPGPGHEVSLSSFIARTLGLSEMINGQVYETTRNIFFLKETVLFLKNDPNL